MRSRLANVLLGIFGQGMRKENRIRDKVKNDPQNEVEEKKINFEAKNILIL